MCYTFPSAATSLPSTQKKSFQRITAHWMQAMDDGVAFCTQGGSSRTSTASKVSGAMTVDTAAARPYLWRK